MRPDADVPACGPQATPRPGGPVGPPLDVRVPPLQLQLSVDVTSDAAQLVLTLGLLSVLVAFGLAFSSAAALLALLLERL